MNFGQDAGAASELVVGVHEELAGLVVQRGLREGDDEEAANYLENVLENHIGGPVALERIYAYVSVAGDVGVVDLGQEVALRRRRGILGPNHNLHQKSPSSIWSTLCIAIAGNYVSTVDEIKKHTIFVSGFKTNFSSSQRLLSCSPGPVMTACTSETQSSPSSLGTYSTPSHGLRTRSRISPIKREMTAGERFSVAMSVGQKVDRVNTRKAIKAVVGRINPPPRLVSY